MPISHSKRRKKQRLAKDANIAVVGGGLGGLGTAISLQKEGFTNVTVYERDASLEESNSEGYGLTLSYNPKGPLAKMGILEQVAENDCPSRSHYIFGTDGSVLGYFGNAFSPKHMNRGMGQRGNLRVPRRVLRRILLDNIAHADNVQWGKRLQSFDQPSKENHSKESLPSSSIESSSQYRLLFEDGTTAENVDLLVGADGIRSKVVQMLLKHTQDDDGNNAELQYLGIMIILGISPIHHPLLDERGFYTLDGTHRLFTMPYEGSKVDDEIMVNQTQQHRRQRQIMWQLSYRLEDEDEAKRLRSSGPQALRDEVLRRCKSWHDPVMEMVQLTPLDTIWGTGLMNRDPDELQKNLNPYLSERVVLLGDAAHSMSPFKGQGANQSLTDGPLLASWLTRANTESAIRSFMREMITRTSAVVRASRDAASFLHSPRVLLETPEFAGVELEAVAPLLEALRNRNIGAHMAGSLDQTISNVIDELNMSDNVSKIEKDERSMDKCNLQKQALSFAADGNTFQLRDLSIVYSETIRTARDENERSCLHLAAAGGHYQCCRWLLTEAFVSRDVRDSENQSPLDVAIKSGHEKVISLLKVTQSHIKSAEGGN